MTEPLSDTHGEAIVQRPQPCACRFEWRPMPDFSGAPPKQLDECGFHSEQRKKLEAQRPSLAAPKDDVPLRCEVVNGAIEFTIGAKVLAHATNISPNLYDAENDRGQYRVTDPSAFAKEVARELDRESEDGSTPLTRLLDTVIEEAINQGAEGVEENK